MNPAQMQRSAPHSTQWFGESGRPCRAVGSAQAPGQPQYGPARGRSRRQCQPRPGEAHAHRIVARHRLTSFHAFGAGRQRTMRVWIDRAEFMDDWFQYFGDPSVSRRGRAPASHAKGLAKGRNVVRISGNEDDGGWAFLPIARRHHVGDEASVVLLGTLVAEVAPANGKASVFRYPPERIVRIEKGSDHLQSHAYGRLWDPLGQTRVLSGQRVAPASVAPASGSSSLSWP